DVHRALLRQAARHAQALQLARDLEAVARLDLDRGDALAHHRVEPRPRLARELLLRRFTGGLHRREDAPAGARDVLVAGTLESHLELACAVAGVDEVRMAI